MPMYDLTSSIIQYLDTLKTVGYVEESSIVALLIASLIDDCSKEPLKEFPGAKSPAPHFQANEIPLPHPDAAYNLLSPFFHLRLPSVPVSSFYNQYIWQLIFPYSIHVLQAHLPYGLLLHHILPQYQIYCLLLLLYD